MPIINRLLIAVIVWELLFLFTLPLRAQPAPESIPVMMTAQERGVILGMCDQAIYAAKRQFDGACDYFKAKFDAAERDAKVKSEAKPAEIEKKD